jgi:hypothetical protein
VGALQWGGSASLGSVDRFGRHMAR